MAKQADTAIKPTRAENYPEWYQQVVSAADLAENSPVRGCMVIKPWGYALWENIQRVLDKMFKDTGHVNAYFPLFIPLSFLQQEADHVEGFAKECAVVTHHRLTLNAEGKLEPAADAKLEEPLIVRPTSETIIGHMFAKWVQSHRDLPILVNQWANVVRWELRTRLFLRTAEFLWQEGHTAHATADEAMEETRKMLDVYAEFAETYMAVPVIKGEKTEGERFPGAVSTFAIEAMMQDRKALQAGTSHFLGQNFAKAQGIKYQSDAGVEEFCWTTSWGVSTRLIGGLIMTHADDDGMVMPPRLAPKHVIIMPIHRNPEEAAKVLDYCKQLAADLQKVPYHEGTVQVEIDNRESRGGEKNWKHIKRGAPIRLEVGPRDMEKDAVFMGRRDKGPKEKSGMARTDFIANVASILDEIQSTLYQRALENRQKNTQKIDTQDEFIAYFTPKNAENPEPHGGFALCHFSDGEELQAFLKEHKVTIRCVPLDGPEEDGQCFLTGKPSKKRAIFAKAY